jgi:hypothetical protein
MNESIYYAIGYNYQRPSEWFAGSHEEALVAFGNEVTENKNKRVRMLVEVYSVDTDNENDEHECQRGCPLHLASKHEWIYKGWVVPPFMRKLATRIS